LAQSLQVLGYKSTKADPDVWIRKAVKPNGYDHYEMLFVYVDDIISVSHRTKEAIKEITKYYKAKDRSIKEPNIYLGANVAKLKHGLAT